MTGLTFQNATFSSAGYKSYVKNATSVPISIASVGYSPHGGNFVVISMDPYNAAANDTTISCPGTNSTGRAGNATQSPTSAPQGEIRDME